MQSSSQNKINRSFANLFPSIHKAKPPTNHQKQSSFQLNNEGCRCETCQKIIIHENMKIVSEQIVDVQSQQFSKDSTKEYYIQFLQQIGTLWKFKRMLRFCLPEVCLYKDAHPYALFEKKKQKSPIFINKSKSRLHFFQIQSFFLTGYITHSSSTSKHSTSKTLSINKPYLNQCIIFAKYDGNFYRMLTYNQIESIFRLKNRHMKEGLMYLQTIVGGEEFNTKTVIVRLDDMETNYEMKVLFERAKAEVRIIVGEVRVTDAEYFQQAQQISFQNDLKSFDINQYLLYLSYKMILIQSKLKPQVMKNSIFKYSTLEKKVYLFDLRVKQYGSSVNYWSSNASQALQIKLKKTMSLMQIENTPNEDKLKMIQNQLSSKATQLSEWLRESTSEEWQEMRVIRKRLERLQQEKKSLQNSKKQQQLRKSLKMKNLQNKKTKYLQSFSHLSSRV